MGIHRGLSQGGFGTRVPCLLLLISQETQDVGHHRRQTQLQGVSSAALHDGYRQLMFAHFAERSRLSHLLSDRLQLRRSGGRKLREEEGEALGAKACFEVGEVERGLDCVFPDGRVRMLQLLASACAIWRALRETRERRLRSSYRTRSTSRPRASVSSGSKTRAPWMLLTRPSSREAG